MTNTEDIEGWIDNAKDIIPILRGDGYFVESDLMLKLSRALQSQQTTLELFRAEVKSNVKAMKAAKAKILAQQEEIAILQEAGAFLLEDGAKYKAQAQEAEDKVDQLTKERDVLKSQGTLDESVIRDAGVRLKRYRKELEFYADEKNYLEVHAENPVPEVLMDLGDRAREALQDTPELPRRTLRKSSSVTDEQRKKAYDAAIVSPEGGCEHGRDMTESCLECGRVNGGE